MHTRVNWKCPRRWSGSGGEWMTKCVLLRGVHTKIAVYTTRHDQFFGKKKQIIYTLKTAVEITLSPSPSIAFYYYTAYLVYG